MAQPRQPASILTRFPATITLAVITTGIFLTQWVLGGTTVLAVQMRLGMAQPDLIFQHGEWFRLVTPIFLHHGPIHFGMNGFAFLQLCAICEIVFGSLRTVTFYLLCGVASSLASVTLMDAGITGSVGASGAIMGLAGLLLGTSWFGVPELRDKLRKALGRRLLLGVIMTFALGFGMLLVLPIIDNWGHLGGFSMGVLLATTRPNPRKRPGSVLTITGGATLGISAAALLWMSVVGGASSSSDAMAAMFRSRAMSDPDGFITGLAAAEMVRAYHDAGRDQEALRATRELMERCTTTVTPAMLSLQLVQTPYEREAAVALNRWLTLDPDDPEANNGSAWFMVTATSPRFADPAEALRLSRRSLELLDDDGTDHGAAIATYLDTQALAWFRLGNPKRAIQVQEESNVLAASAGIDLPGAQERMSWYTTAVTPLP